MDNPGPEAWIEPALMRLTRLLGRQIAREHFEAGRVNNDNAPVAHDVTEQVDGPVADPVAEIGHPRYRSRARARGPKPPAWPCFQPPASNSARRPASLGG